MAPFQVRHRLKGRTGLVTVEAVIKAGSRKGDCDVRGKAFLCLPWLHVRVVIDWRFVLAVTTLAKVLLR
jgi:hypothetical protein